MYAFKRLIRVATDIYTTNLYLTHLDSLAPLNHHPFTHACRLFSSNVITDFSFPFYMSQFVWIARESISFTWYRTWRTINQRRFRNMQLSGWLGFWMQNGRKEGKQAEGDRAQVSRIWIGIPPPIVNVADNSLGIMPRSRRSVHVWYRTRTSYSWPGGTGLLARK